MRRLGLALSGGGFRATIFHLGLVRFLRDAGILPDVTHITSVSGGSIIAAHLALNWDRYCGSAEQFESAATELLDYMQLDVRNRIVRRYPFTIPVRIARRLLKRDADRWLTRTGLLESYYRRRLFGETSLFELPERPQLHMLATNLSEGGLCSFTREGLIMQHRTSPSSFRFDRIQVDLATVAMGVAASSAFPGFFPPLQLSSSEVGASQGDFGRQAFTDGGIFDNLGIRMFRFIERAWIGREARLQAEDFLDVDAALVAVNASVAASEGLPGGRFASLLSAAAENRTRFENADELLECLSKLMRDEQLYRNPVFDGLQLPLTDAQTLLDAARSSDEQLDRHDHLWLNRQILGATFQLMTGKPCLRPFGAGLDGILVSDAGRPFQTVTESQPTSMVGTSIRSSDILMDRVGQLERETFQDAPGLVFAATSHEVTPEEDETALPVAVQRRIATIRTDMDRFSADEISSLLRHGYCVGRKTCRENNDLFGEDIPSGPPWDPAAPHEPAAKILPKLRARHKTPSEPTRQARKLHKSSQRRIWSTMWDYRDWVSYIYIPLLVPILLFGPYIGYRMYEQSQLISSVTGSLQHAGPMLVKAFDLLEEGPVEPWESMPFEEVVQFEPEGMDGVEILQDQRIIDLRRRGSRYEYHRLQLRRSSDADGPAFLRLNEQAANPAISVRSPDSTLRPRLSRELQASEASDGGFTWQIAFDLSHIPPGEPTDIVIETQQPQGDIQPVFSAEVTGDPGVATLFLLLPRNQPFRDYWVLRTDPEQPALVEKVVPNSAAGGGNDTVIMLQIARPEPGSVYECHWTWRDED